MSNNGYVFIGTIDKAIRLDVGCGTNIHAGYTHMDIKSNNHIEIIGDCRKLPFPDNSIEEILASHIIEHFSYTEIVGVLKEWYRALQLKGQLIIKCPDLDFLCRAYVSGHHTPEQILVYLYGAFTFNACTPDGRLNNIGTYNEPDAHKAMYNEEMIMKRLEEIGFIIISSKREHDWEIKIIAIKENEK